MMINNTQNATLEQIRDIISPNRQRSSGFFHRKAMIIKTLRPATS